ncbi:MULTISPECIES: SURF1 family protein [unclassified Shinella]|uniref:SURF1 family protein n=1 Tax=unclassified Shinella TaxID=2643062 RepID=UPI00225CAFFD|nr:SURF1 family protein [Shinella sp. YE25]MDC7259325.1 SURF1 family protein [Shinella sp. YE25]CAI0336115.1 SURF1-like protein [Rhizobiaceae bacterium]CAK7261504.1 SURF1-like protein [Shinella sp. WSC3-e]
MSEPSARARRLLTGFLLVLVAVFLALGTWQVQRLFWKLDLIARVESRVHADAVPAPARAEWPAVSREKDEYRRVTATGLFRHDKTVLVQAVTERGAGFWVLTPLLLPDETAVLVNRGFVPADRRDPAARVASELAAGPVTVTGLLRLSEPGGAFLRANDPAADRWFSRDVAAITAAKGLSGAAPYFIDADATPNPGGLPVGGLTVVAFRNSHLVYALTWYALAAMSAAGAWAVHRRRLG